MGKAIYETLSNEEALKEFGRSSFVFVGGTGLIPEHVSVSNQTQDQKEDDRNFRTLGPKIEPKQKG